MIRWITAFVDMPADTFDAGTRFWEQVTNSRRSAARGASGEFATLVPADGDAHLRVQRIDAGPPGVHLDLHVDDVEQAAAAAVALGATEVRGGEYRTLHTPGGYGFCIVRHMGAITRTSPDAALGAPIRVDQLTLDLPADRHDADLAFWQRLTGWPVEPGSRPEFHVLSGPAEMPLRLLLQRTESDGPIGAHLDLACGPAVPLLAAAHVRLGARVEQDRLPWTTLQAPSGHRYCLTPRDPTTGRRPV